MDTNTIVNARINEVKNEIHVITNLATAATLNAKINEVKNKIRYMANVATTTVLTTIENKLPNVSNLVKRLTIIQNLVKLNIKLLLILIMINTLIHQVKIRKFYCKISTRKFSKQKLYY